MTEPGVSAVQPKPRRNEEEIRADLALCDASSVADKRFLDAVVRLAEDSRSLLAALEEARTEAAQLREEARTYQTLYEQRVDALLVAEGERDEAVAELSATREALHERDEAIEAVVQWLSGHLSPIGQQPIRDAGDDPAKRLLAAATEVADAYGEDGIEPFSAALSGPVPPKDKQ